jgi:hypothetical protein
MNTVALKKISITHELSRVPESRLDTILTYLETLLHDVAIPPPRNMSLKGIWKDTGLGDIPDVERELRHVRQELQQSILARSL